MALKLTHYLLLSLFAAIVSLQCEAAYASVVRGLKKDNKGGCGSFKKDPTVAIFPKVIGCLF